MRKVLCVLLVSVFFVSCDVYNLKIVPLNYVNVWDYSLLTDQGIFVTESNSVGFDYKTIGSIYIELREGERKEANDNVNYTVRDKRNMTKSEKKEAQYIRYSPNYVVAKIGEELKKINANGIVNLKIVYDKNYIDTSNSQLNTDQKKKGLILHGPGYIITGMAIKR
ncbi:MAG: hypothetical protein LBS20_13805 [Prevotella sp.]|jgi:hypothetical protein|nr:hypothetical protein [Prevotella sp.]